MIRRLKLVLLALIVGCMLSPALASASDEEAIDTFFRLSGLEQQIRDLPDILIEQFNEERSLLTAASQRNVLSVIEQVFNPDLLVADARAYLTMVNTEPHLEVVNAWLNSDLTRRMNDLETASNEDVTFEDRDRFFARLETQRPPESRLELVNRLEASTEATYYLVSIITDMYLTLIQIMSNYMPPDERIAPERLPELRYSIMNELLPMYRDITFAMNLYTYRDVTDEDLDIYVSFYETEAGRWFADVSFEIINHVLLEAGKRLSNN